MKRRGLIPILLLAGCSLTRLDLGGAEKTDAVSDAGGPRDAGIRDASSPSGDAGNPREAGLDAAPGLDGSMANLEAGTNTDAASDTEAGSDAGAPNQVQSFAVGGTFTCAVRNDSKVKCWGAATFGQLGIAPGEADSDCSGTPCDSVPRSSPGLTSVRELALGEAHGCMVDLNNGVACWGENRFGQLGRGSSDADPHPVPLALSRFDAGQKIVSGRFHNCAIDEGKVFCWGLNHKGQLGVVSTATCTVNDAALLSELGIVGSDAPCESEPVEVPGFSGALALYAFAHQTCAINGGGTLLCWGENDAAQLAQTASPTLPVTSFPRQDQRAFALGASHGCGAFGADNRLRCWGSHEDGALGVGSTALSTCGSVPCSATPITLANLMSADLVAAGETHSCAALDGNVRCWGSDARGQLGNSENAISTCGSEPCARTPVEVVDLSGVRQLRSGPYHICALTSALELYCWGANDLTQSGGADKLDRGHASLIYGLER